MSSGHNVGLCRGYQPYQPWVPHQQGPHSTPNAHYYTSSTHGYGRPCTVSSSLSSSGSSTGKRTPLGSFKAPTHTVKRSHGTERSSRNVQGQKSVNDEQKTGSRHRSSRRCEPRFHRSKMAEERLNHNYSPISCDTLLSEGEIASDENAHDSSRDRKIARSAAASDREKAGTLTSAKRRRLMSVVNNTPSDESPTSERQDLPRKSRTSTESSSKTTSSVRDDRQLASVRTSHSSVINGRSAGKSSNRHSTRFDSKSGKSTTKHHQNSPKNPHHGVKAKTTPNAEMCSPEDAFAYAYLDHSLNPSSRPQDTERAEPRQDKVAAPAGGEGSSEDVKSSNKERGIPCNTCMCNAQKQTSEKSTSTEEFFAHYTAYYREVGNRSPETGSSMVGCLDRAASFICTRNDATVRKWIVESGAYSPSSPTRTLEIDQETVSLTSEPSEVGSCDMDLSGTEYDHSDMDICNTDKAGSLAPSVISEERKEKEERKERRENRGRCNREPQTCSVSPRAAKNCESYSIMKHERSCKCGSVLAAVNFELDVYTACSVLELCEDTESKEEALRLYAEARELCSKEQHLERIRQLVRMAVEGKRSSWKNATSVLRKLAAIRWSTFPSAQVPGVTVAINSPRMAHEKTSRGKV